MRLSWALLARTLAVVIVGTLVGVAAYARPRKAALVQLAAHAPCPDCINAIPPKIEELLTVYVRDGCYLDSDLDHLRDETGDEAQCADLARQLTGLGCSPGDLDEQMNAEQFKLFKLRFKDPCQPIPTKYLNKGAPFFGAMLGLLAPQIVTHPDEAYPPLSLDDITNDLTIESRRAPGYGKGAQVFGYSEGRDHIMSRRTGWGSAKCDPPGKKVGKRCCGTYDTPIYTDVPRSASDATVSHPFSINFTTVHAYGTYENTGLGSHAFDSESVQYEFEPAGSGAVRLKHMIFSRHGLATEDVVACDKGKYVFGSPKNVNAAPPGQGAHPVLFQANGGHALYPAADYPRGLFTPMRTDSALEKAADASETGHPFTAIEKSDLEKMVSEYHRPGGCVAKLDPRYVEGIGSLWNSPIGVNRYHKYGDADDVCLELKPAGPTGGPTPSRSLRYLNWIGGGEEAFRKFGCGYVPGQ